MTTTANRSLLGASSKAAQWNAIDWHVIERQVQRLQMRIAKATREQLWRVTGSGQPGFCKA